MIDYKIDLSKPFTIVNICEGTERVKVYGCSRVLQTQDGEFGGVCDFWDNVPIKKLWSKEQKRKLKRTHREEGDEAANDYYQKTCAQVIAEHSNNIIA